MCQEFHEGLIDEPAESMSSSGNEFQIHGSAKNAEMTDRQELPTNPPVRAGRDRFEGSKMMKSLDVLLIEDSADYAALVQHWLSSSTHGSFALDWADSLDAGLKRLGQGKFDVVLLDLGLPDSDGIQTYFAVRERAARCAMVVLSAGDNEALALRMIQEGAEDYLVKSTCTAQSVIRSIQYAVARHRSQPSQEASGQNSRILGVVGAKGGVGTTTIACHLAAELQQQTKQDVLLAELDRSAGLVPFLMGVEPQYSILDAMANLEHLDRNFWDGIVTRASNQLSVIAGPKNFEAVDTNPYDLRRLLSQIRPFHDWIVADLGRICDASPLLLQRIDELFIVTTSSIPSLYQAKKMIDAAADSGIERERLRLLINQSEQTPSLSGKEITQIFGVPVWAVIPNETEHLYNVYLHRSLANRSSALGVQIAKLSRRIAGISDEPSRGALAHLFSFMRRSNRVAPVEQSGAAAGGASSASGSLPC